LKGMKRWLRDAASMENTARWIYEVSPMMRGRGDTATQDLADLRGHLETPGGWFDELTRTVTKDRYTQQDIVDAFTWHIGFAQKFADVRTWLGAYEKAAGDRRNYNADRPLDEARVVALADQAVIDSQGSGSVKDLSQAQRG